MELHAAVGIDTLELCIDIKIIIIMKSNGVDQPKRLGSLKTEPSKSFQQNISSIIIQKCCKLYQLINEMHPLRFQKQIANDHELNTLFATLNKDKAMLNHNNKYYLRLLSLICNTKAYYNSQIGNYEQALLNIDEALEIEALSKHPIDCARTLLNKSVILGHLGESIKQSSLKQDTIYSPKQEATLFEKIRTRRKLKNLYSQQTGLCLAKQSLVLIQEGSQRTKEKKSVQNEQYQLNILMIRNFEQIAGEFIMMNNLHEAHTLYKKAYDMAIRVLGSKHQLTKHLNSIIKRNFSQIPELYMMKSESMEIDKREAYNRPPKQRNSELDNRIKSVLTKKSKKRHKSVGKLNTTEGNSYIRANMNNCKVMSGKFPQIHHNIKEIIKQGENLSLIKPSYQKKSIIHMQTEEPQISHKKFTSKTRRPNLKPRNTKHQQSKDKQQQEPQQINNNNCQLI